MGSVAHACGCGRVFEGELSVCAAQVKNIAVARARKNTKSHARG